MTPSASVDLDLMRGSVLLDSNPAAAAQKARDILEQAPGHPEATLLLAAASHRLGTPAAAVSALESLSQEHRAAPLMQLELGRAYRASGRKSEAIAALQRAVESDVNLADGWRELASMWFDAGETQAGDEAYLHYSRLAPAPAELTDAMVALAEDRLSVADMLLRRRLEKAPRDAAALHLLAQAAVRRDDNAEAERRLNECLHLAPGLAAARHDLAQLLQSQHRSGEALPHLERLLAAESGNMDYLNLKAQALRFMGRNAEAISLLEQALNEHPQEESTWLLLGHLLREVGQPAQAIGMYQRALAIRPQSGAAYWSLANLKTFRFAQKDIHAMQEQLEHGSARGIDRTNLEFALGKALEDEGEFAASFEHYALGNTLHRRAVRHDGAAVAAEFQRSKAVFSARFFSERNGWGSERRDPIFIVGLPRSGSTLLEQILASHSQVEGTRELMDIPALAVEMSARAPLTALARPQIDAYAEQYLSRTQAHRPLGRARFVDKMLSNFAHVGLIHLMFPNAAIIDARRHPLGCGFSCYKQLFARDLGYTYDLSDLGRYYREYADLMMHFDTVLPHRVHRVHYESLVADLQGEVRRLLDYCGLPFEPQCLQFHENRRVVQTLSSEQVRLPLYADAVDQWRRYEPWLSPMKLALGTWGEHYPPVR